METGSAQMVRGRRAEAACEGLAGVAPLLAEGRPVTSSGAQNRPSLASFAGWWHDFAETTCSAHEPLSSSTVQLSIFSSRRSLGSRAGRRRRRDLVDGPVA